MKNDIRQVAKEAFAAATAKRCPVCQKRVKLYRETKYLNPVWRCTGCGRTEEFVKELVYG